jgi:hypothetical protein
LVCRAVLGLIVDFRGGNQIDGNENVLLEQGGELVTGALAVEPRDGSPDVFLILEQAGRRGLGAG